MAICYPQRAMERIDIRVLHHCNMAFPRLGRAFEIETLADVNLSPDSEFILTWGPSSCRPLLQTTVVPKLNDTPPGFHKNGDPKSFDLLSRASSLTADARAPEHPQGAKRKFPRMC